MVLNNFKKLAGILNTLGTRLLPRACLLCGQPCEADALCSACRQVPLPGQYTPRCHACALPLSKTEWPSEPALTDDLPRYPALCTTCQVLAPAYDRVIALADYAAPLDRALIALKFGKQLALARPLGMLLMQHLMAVAEAESMSTPSPDTTPNPARVPVSNPPPESAPNAAPNAATNAVPKNAVPNPTASPSTPPDLGVDLLVPIPLSGRRLAMRGFNQSLQIARGMKAFEGAACPPICYDGLIRVRHTLPQSTLSAEARQKNLRGAFAVPRPSRVAGKRIGLVDDVMTTGTTLEEAARTLKAAGAHTVTALVVARTA